MNTAIAIVLVLGGLIFFHELGHFSVARLLGIGVRAFSLGFGPVLYKFRRGKTEYRLSAIPLGGYVSLAGENDENDLTGGFTEKESFIKRPTWHRMLVIVAGPLANLLLAFLIYWGLFWSAGQMHIAPEIGNVRDGSPAAQVGIAEGDTITDIAGARIEYWNDVADTIGKSGGTEISITVLREGQPITFQVVPEKLLRKNIFGEDEESYLIGIAASGKTFTQPLDGVSAAQAGLEHTWEMIVITGKGFAKIIQRVIPMDNVGGPIMIAQMVSQQTEYGVAAVLALAALISVNLGLLNLLPIPVLDGGHLVMLTFETIFRRPVPTRVMDIATRVGILLLITLMVWATFNDVRRL
ncbi:RIP metalloprotease RseP [Desulfovibrio psychrotolerans]|uniref:Zinc metalloprotease n=1 Tax=Desulfovibrio psychrotolerans TaxID=415242 RepID=A0A7J0BTY8_9BACT|nr:RIP metalloprotease RseP [Desulfovibrio psychrotolerans]GFM37179.1 zinc metalloprotease [Desulfovibrio psychrotolerans]